MTENSLITLYFIADDFVKHFLKTEAGQNFYSEFRGKRGPKRKLSVTEVVVLNIVRIIDKVGDLKTFHKNACVHYIKFFPNMPNYENFLKAANKSTAVIVAFVQYLLSLNRKNCTDSVFYLDSTPVTVCENRYINTHKVAKDIARRGKSTKGWFYGFKLHGLCTQDGTLMRLYIQPGNEHDSKAFDAATKGFEGIFVTDAGYLLKYEDLKKLYDSGRMPFTATRKNMKRPMTSFQHILLRQRNVIENVWSVLKLNYNLIYHRARSVNGMFRHFFYSIASFLLHKTKDTLRIISPHLFLSEKLEF